MAEPGAQSSTSNGSPMAAAAAVSLTRTLARNLAAGHTDTGTAARQLADAGDAVLLAELEQFVRALHAEPSVTAATLELLEQTRLARHERSRDDGDQVTADPLPADRLATIPVDQLSAYRLGPADAILVHELRTPIAAAQTAASTLEEHGDRPGIADTILPVLQRNLRLATLLLDGLTLVAKPSASDPAHPPSDCDLAALVRECAQDLADVLTGDHAIDVHVDAPILAPVPADAVREVLYNLLTNAAKFSPRGAPIEITVSSGPGHAEITVRDHGPGIPLDHADQIFDIGKQVNPRMPGLGIGLFVAQQLAQALGGGVSVHAGQPDGAQFILRLPFDTGES
jgi:two-component system, OmpR family, sensor histidine kinase MprB